MALVALQATQEQPIRDDLAHCRRGLQDWWTLGLLKADHHVHWLRPLLVVHVLVEQEGRGVLKQEVPVHSLMARLVALWVPHGCRCAPPCEIEADPDHCGYDQMTGCVSLYFPVSTRELLEKQSFQFLL